MVVERPLTDVVWAALALGGAGFVIRSDAPWAIKASLLAVDAMAAWLFWCRDRASVASVQAWLAAFPSLLLAALSCQVVEGSLSPIREAGVVLASLWTVVAMAALGRSFAVLPQARALVTRGPYALVRNPIYVGEVALVALLGWDAERWWTWCLGPIMGLALAPRIRSEEAALASVPGYAAYCDSVRYRLLPGVV